MSNSKERGSGKGFVIQVGGVRMGLTFSLLLIGGAVVLLVSLRIRGCASFLFWMVLGMAVMWFVLEFFTGGLRL